MKNTSPLAALIRGVFNKNEISDTPIYHINALLKIRQWLQNQVPTLYKVILSDPCVPFLTISSHIPPLHFSALIQIYIHVHACACIQTHTL